MYSANGRVIEVYRDAFLTHGDAPESLLWSAEGQRWRFDKLVEIARLPAEIHDREIRVLEVGCGLGHFYPLLRETLGKVDYTGVDIVPDLIGHANRKYPEARFLLQDIVATPLAETFDYVFISGVFNAPARDDSEAFISALLASAFSCCTEAMCFNFTSSFVNFLSEDTNYFNPGQVLNELATNLSGKIELHHHYRNCDVAVCVRR